MANKKISELPYINSGEISGNTLVPLVTYYSASTGDTVHTYITDLQDYLTSGITASGNYLPLSGGTVTGGTIFTVGLTANTISATTYLNLPATTFSGGTVTGPTTFTNGLTATTISATTYQNLPTDVRVTGGTYSAGTITFTNNTGGTFNVTGLTTGSTSTVSGNYLPLSGGTVTGGTIFQSGLTATTISATTYQNLPTDIRVTGGTYSAGTITFTNNTGGTFNVTGLTTGSTSTVSGDFLPLSGGTVTGNTTFTSGLTANTLNVNGLTQTSGITSTSGIIFKQVTINGSYTATTSDYMIDITGGTFTVSLPTAVGQQGRLYVIKNNGGGAVTVDPFGSETIDGKSFIVLGETNSIQLASNGTEWVAMSYNISTVNSSTGVFEFSGLTIASPTTFTVAPIKGWIVDDTTNPLSPQLYYVTYSGGTHTATYVTATTETWIYLTSGGTISQSNILITDQQRRQNIALGKLGHANKTSIINAFSQPDFVLSPLAQLRDMFEPINLINGGIKTSANGANLSFNTSAGYLHGLGINFANDTLNPNSLYVTGTAPCTFQYRTQTGGTASNTTFIDPTKKDVGGVVTTLSGTKATNQRIYLVQNGVFRVQYGQVEYSNLTQAIAGIATEQFVEFTNFTTNGILIGVLSVLSTATDLTDTAKAQFFNVSKFGDSTGAAGGSPTTNLQQAYNNSIEPEITTNSTLGALSVKNGAGTADNITNVFEGANTAGSTTSYVRADGFISGNSLNAPNLTISGGTQSIFSGNSSSDLVRITQTGVGNAFVVEDSTNTDSTPFVIDASGNTGIGVTVPDSKLHISNSNSVDTNSISLKVIGTGTSEQFLIYRDGRSVINTTTSGVSFNIVNSTQLRTFVNSTGFQILDSGGYGFHHTTSFGGLNVGNTNGYLYLWSQASDILRLFLGGQDRNPTVARTRTVINPVPSSSTLFSPTGGTAIDYSFQNAGQSVFSPTGGTATYTQIELRPSYSGTGSYSGTVTGLLYNPNLLSMSGTTHRAIQTTTGDVIFGSTSGNVGIGTTTPRQRLDVNGNTIISSGLTAQTGVFSSSSQNVLTVIGSGNSTTSPLFSVQGSSGELFSVTDSLVGSLFSVNDISGLPIMEVFSDNTTLWGSYQAPSLNTTTRTSLTAGTNTIYSIPTSAYTGAFYEYTLISTGTTGARAGQIMSIWSGTSANFTETSTLDIGTTTGVTFTVAVSGNNAVLSSSATTAGWTVKTIIRSI